MRFSFIPTVITAAALSFSSMALHAQNVAIVNGKAVPKTRLNMLAAQVERSGRSVTPDMEQQLREEVIMREIFMQEAEKQGLEASDDYKIQLEIAKQSILIRELFTQYQKTNPVSDADIKAEYDKFVAGNSGKEYRARHILV
jgi:peptidyl-prolyl cis-trans isomerase C